MEINNIVGRIGKCVPNTVDKSGCNLTWVQGYNID